MSILGFDGFAVVIVSVVEASLYAMYTPIFVWVVPRIAAHPAAAKTVIPVGEFWVMAKSVELIIPVDFQIACVVSRSFSAG
jgi:hypothetical protein